MKCTAQGVNQWESNHNEKEFLALAFCHLTDAAQHTRKRGQCVRNTSCLQVLKIQTRCSSSANGKQGYQE